MAKDLIQIIEETIKYLEERKKLLLIGEDENRLIYSIPQSAKMLSWNNRRLWDKVHEHRDAILNSACINMECIGQCKNGIPTVRIGKRYFITKEALELFIKNITKSTFEEVLHGK